MSHERLLEHNGIKPLGKVSLIIVRVQKLGIFLAARRDAAQLSLENIAWFGPGREER